MANYGSLFGSGHAGLAVIRISTYAWPGFSRAAAVSMIRLSSLDYGMRRDVAERNRHPRSVT